MRRLLMFMLMLVVGCAGQQRIYHTANLPNGFAWRGNSQEMKKAFVAGIKWTVLAVPFAHLVPTTKEALTLYVDKWLPVMDDKLLRELDEFYGSPANVPLPIFVAIVHTLMKFNGLRSSSLTTTEVCS
jgi:hypothetical protein